MQKMRSLLSRKIRTDEWLSDGFGEHVDNVDRRFIRLNLSDSKSFIADTDLYRDAWKMQKGIVDRYIPADLLSVGMVLDSTREIVVPVLLAEGNQYKFTTTSFSQLCEKSGMGAIAYMKKCMSSGLLSLVPNNLNAWLAAQGSKSLFVRFYGDKVIAVLSNKYGLFDHGDALECLNETLGQNSNYRLEACSLTLDNLSVRLVDTEQILIKDDSMGRDKSVAGLIFRNGQTGRSLASIEFLIYTFACTNGLIVSQDRGFVYKRRHISIGKREFVEQITAMLEQFPEYAAAAREDMEKARQVRIDASMHASLKQQIQRGLGVGEGTVKEIFDVMEEKWDANAWGMAGAITEVAQKFSAERQYQFEKYAGELLGQLVA
jgi:hypothetical protein